MENDLSLFSPFLRAKPRFMAFATAVLSQVNDLRMLVQSGFPTANDLETAVGIQLDALGELLNIPRPSQDMADESYRFLLRARIAAYHWNGTNETLPAVLEAAFPGLDARLIDNLDGTVTASLEGNSPFSPQELFPCPAGIRMLVG